MSRIKKCSKWAKFLVVLRTDVPQVITAGVVANIYAVT